MRISLAVIITVLWLGYSPRASAENSSIIASGVVYHTGEKISGTTNWSAHYDSKYQHYVIQIYGVDYDKTYTTVITPIFTDAVTCNASDIGYKSPLIVRCQNNKGTIVKSGFGFIVRKYQISINNQDTSFGRFSGFYKNQQWQQEWFGTPNIIPNYDDSLGRYLIKFDNLYYNYTFHTTVVTASRAGDACVSGSFDWKLSISCFDRNGNSKKTDFSFITIRYSRQTEGDYAAFGVVSKLGERSGGTNNWSSRYDAAEQRYQLEFENLIFQWPFFTTIISPIEGRFVTCSLKSADRNAYVYCYDRNGAKMQVAFSFIMIRSQQLR